MSIWNTLGSEIKRFNEGIREIPVTRPFDPKKIKESLRSQFDFKNPMDMSDLVVQVSHLLKSHNLHVTHPRYFGLFNPSVRESGIVADALVALYNPQLAVWSHAPIANEIEQYTLGVFKNALGFDKETTHANFTTGGAEANFSAVLAALIYYFPQISAEGLAGVKKRPLIYLTAESHHSFVKIVRQTGLGTNSIVEIVTNAKHKLSPSKLEQRIISDKSSGAAPLMIVGTAGTTGAGLVDPLPELAEIAERNNLWFHVDAAWGGSASLSPKLRQHLNGIEHADSVTWDAHKWLSVPMGAGMFFCKNIDAINRAFSITTSYMPGASGGNTIDPYSTSVQWSRRMIGLKVFIILAELGLDGLISQVEGQARMGDILRNRLLQAGWLIRNDTDLPVICFTNSDIVEGKISTEKIVSEIQARGKVWISDVTLGGKEKVLRACVTSFRTNEDDIECLLNELELAMKLSG